MTVKYRVLQPNDIQTSKSHQEFALDVLIGLSQYAKSLSSKYLYDDQGDKLFQQITELPEYYLTQCEYEIFQNHKQEIAQIMGDSRFNLIELGAGDGRKTKVLLEYFLETGLDFRYVPIDICETTIQGLIGELDRYSPQLQTEGLVAEYFEGLKWLSTMNEHHNVVLFLGSNIGNFSHFESRIFLCSLWNALNDGDHLLIGFDLKKDIKQLEKAYNDSQGITAQFNLNLLQRINRELGGNFNPGQFHYHSIYNVSSGAMESYLVSRQKQDVYIETLNQSFSFKAWEPIHIEYSYKFLDSDISQLAEETCFKPTLMLNDPKRYFADSIWEVIKGR